MIFSIENTNVLNNYFRFAIFSVKYSFWLLYWTSNLQRKIIYGNNISWYRNGTKSVQRTYDNSVPKIKHFIFSWDCEKWWVFCPDWISELNVKIKRTLNKGSLYISNQYKWLLWISVGQLVRPDLLNRKETTVLFKFSLYRYRNKDKWSIFRVVSLAAP